MKALGLIEVNGYLAAIEAADSALKAANVSLISIEKVTGGICTVEITGDVGAVKASVEAGATATESLGLLRSVSVIPRLHEETLKIILPKKKGDALENKASSDFSEIVLQKENIIKEIMNKTDEEIIKKDKIQQKKESKEEIQQEINKTEQDYSSIKVQELRRMVRSLKLPNVTNKVIKFAKKDLLIKMLLDNKEEGGK